MFVFGFVCKRRIKIYDVELTLKMNNINFWVIKSYVHYENVGNNFLMLWNNNVVYRRISEQK